MENQKESICLVCDSPLICKSFSKSLAHSWSLKRYYVWAACNSFLPETLPKLIVYFISNDLNKEKDFEFFLDSFQQTKLDITGDDANQPTHTDTFSARSKPQTFPLKRPKIVLVSTISNSTLHSFCKKYNIEGAIDYTYHKASLSEVVRRVLEGEIIWELDDAEIIIPKYSKLTKPELVFAKLLLDDNSKKQVMALLKISEKTFRRRRDSLYKKCKVSSPLGLYKVFLYYGWLD